MALGIEICRDLAGFVEMCSLEMQEYIGICKIYAQRGSLRSRVVARSVMPTSSPHAGSP